MAHVRRPSELSKAVAVLVEQGIDRLIVGRGVVARLAGRDIVMGILPLDKANDCADAGHLTPEEGRQ